MSEASFTLAELERRLLNIIRFGSIESVDLNTATCRVKLADTHTTGDLSWQTQRAGNVRTWSPPRIGEQVMVFSPAGDLTQGVVMTSIYQNAHPAPSASADEHITDYGDGTVIKYNTASHTLHINCTTAVEVIAPKVELGGMGGAKVARVGDLVAVGAGSSAGNWPIVSGSAIVSAT